MNTLCWIRRDLRLHDHAALSSALTDGTTTVAFIFDTHILEKLKQKDDQRLTFIYDSLKELEVELQKKGSSLIILHGKPEIEIPKLARELKVDRVVCNRDYEPYAKKRDALVEKNLGDIAFDAFKDSVFFEKHEVLNGQGLIYKVFTPYKNKWIETFEASGKAIPDFKCALKNLRQFKNKKNILDHDWYKELGFLETKPLLKAGVKAGQRKLKEFSEQITDYKKTRDFPVLEGTSLISVYIRHGNVSIRELITLASAHRDEGSKTWLSELIWRDFYFVILDAHPEITKQSYKPEYDQINWLGTEAHFKAWCEGTTGFPIIDATMRCFNETGMMHNRLRMVVASFLCKILLVNWRKGEEYFADYLLDFDLSANNGGWQWCSSSGVDAQPYFRIFNPYNQSQKFDPDGAFIKKWCPELAHLSKKEIHRPDAPTIVNYENNRVKCLDMYSVVKKKVLK